MLSHVRQHLQNRVPVRPSACRPPCPAELYNELQGLPEALRSEFPDLAVDFLATVFKAAPASAAAAAGKPPQHHRCALVLPWAPPTAALAWCIAPQTLCELFE